MNRKFNKMVLFTLILFISMGFAVLTANLSMVANLSFRENTFDVHFENSKVLSTSTSIDNTVTIDTNNPTSLSFQTTLTKPTDYLDFTFYVVNNGTVDAQLSSINVGLTTEQLNYISYTLTYDIDGTTVSANDYLYKGQYKRIKAHFEYRYDIDNLYSSGTLNTTITFNYIQPQTVTTTVWTYDYSEAEQYFIAPKTGIYQIELWGASGGTTIANGKTFAGGKGAYTSGRITLNKNNKIYIYVGELGGSVKGANLSATAFNGGGASAANSTNGVATIAGGATDIRISSSLNDRIMVAAGGGGASYYPSNNYDSEGGAGGGLTGYNGIHVDSTATGKGGTQLTYGLGGTRNNNCNTAAGFGIGGSSKKGYHNAGGGGGYWGGGAGGGAGGPGGGGSSYISGHTGCIAIVSNSSTAARVGTGDAECLENTTDNLCSKHYSGRYFTSTIMIDGNGYKWTNVVGNAIEGMPTHDGTGTMTGNIGNGYAKITYIG